MQARLSRVIIACLMNVLLNNSEIYAEFIGELAELKTSHYVIDKESIMRM